MGEAKMLNKIVEGAKQRREEMEKEHQPQTLGEAPADGSETAKEGENTDPGMEVVDGMKVSAVSGKTLKNEHGNYPVWVSKRKIAQINTKRTKPPSMSRAKFSS